MSRTALAFGTEVAAAAAHHDPADRAAAPATSLAGPLIDAQPGQEISGAALNVDVVAEAGALKLDRALQDLLHRPVQATGSLGGEPARLGQGMNPRFEERFVRVDVAETGEDLLVEQPAFDRAATSPRGVEELLFRDLRRIRPEPPKNSLQLVARAATEPAETARVAKANLLSAVLENQSHVGVRLKSGVARDNHQLSRHAETHYEKAASRVF